MWFHHKNAAAAQAPSGAAANATASGITAAEYWLGIFILAMAMLGAALIIHHGLVP